MPTDSRACACLDTRASLRSARQAHALHNPTQRKEELQQKRRLKYGVARRLSAIPAFLYAAAVLVAFAHLLNHFGAYFPHKHAFVPAVEVVEQEQFFIFLPDSRYYVLVHNVGNKVLI